MAQPEHRTSVDVDGRVPARPVGELPCTDYARNLRRYSIRSSGPKEDVGHDRLPPWQRLIGHAVKRHRARDIFVEYGPTLVEFSQFWLKSAEFGGNLPDLVETGSLRVSNFGPNQPSLSNSAEFFSNVSKTWSTPAEVSRNLPNLGRIRLNLGRDQPNLVETGRCLAEFADFGRNRQKFGRRRPTLLGIGRCWPTYAKLGRHPPSMVLEEGANLAEFGQTSLKSAEVGRRRPKHGGHRAKLAGRGPNLAEIGQTLPGRRPRSGSSAEPRSWACRRLAPLLVAASPEARAAPRTRSQRGGGR